MRSLALLFIGTFLLSGCAVLEEAYFVDREYGQAQISTWDSQVVYPDYRHAAKTPETIDGITAEEIMSVYNETFAEAPEEVSIFQFDITQ